MALSKYRKVNLNSGILQAHILKYQYYDTDIFITVIHNFTNFNTTGIL